MKSILAKIICLPLGLFLLSFTISEPLIYGHFRSIKMVTYSGAEVQSTFYYGQVKLYPEAVDLKKPFLASKLGQVTFNNIPLSYHSGMKLYVDSVERVNDEGISWAVTSNSTVGDFNYTSTLGYPIFMNINNIPDTIFRSKDYTVSLTGLNNADYTEFVFDDFTFHTQVPWYRKVSTPSSVIILPGSSFNIITSNTGFVRLVFTKGEYKMINGKNFRFDNVLIVVKPVKLLN